jgi:hypothetical protein
VRSTLSPYVQSATGSSATHRAWVGGSVDGVLLDLGFQANGADDRCVRLSWGFPFETAVRTGTDANKLGYLGAVRTHPFRSRTAGCVSDFNA